ncbi:MAG: hypothetical protein H0U03_04035 [Actinobacteria bacterium]|nr:hypothetical protein [Actinomycetota bacterium]
MADEQTTLADDEILTVSTDDDTKTQSAVADADQDDMDDDGDDSDGDDSDSDDTDA